MYLLLPICFCPNIIQEEPQDRDRKGIIVSVNASLASLVSGQFAEMTDILGFPTHVFGLFGRTERAEKVFTKLHLSCRGLAHQNIKVFLAPMERSRSGESRQR